jgi:hypothetical protein
MKGTIRVDTDQLKAEADELRALADSLNRAGETLQTRVAAAGGDAGLRASARGDALAAGERIQTLRRQLADQADRLASIARAFESVDDQTVAVLARALDGLRPIRAIPDVPPLPEEPGFEPYSQPETRMVAFGSITVFVGDPDHPTKRIWKKCGQFIRGILGVYTQPGTGKKYYVAFLGCDDTGKPIYGYMPFYINLSGPVDLSTIPLRKGEFSDGEAGDCTGFPEPWGKGRWPPDWIANEWWLGGPLQDLNLKKMGLKGMLDAWNKNLCGELSVLETLGIADIPFGLEQFAGMGTRSKNILSKDKPILGTDLIAFFLSFGYAAAQKTGPMPTPSDLAHGLAAGGKYIFLTDLDTTTGKLSSGGHASHWVALQGVFQNEDGNFFVEVFNPYNNQPEYYSWDSFVATCKSPGVDHIDPKTGEKVAPIGPIYVQADPKAS